MSPPDPGAGGTVEVSGIILAGGQGRRMGNRDKGWVNFGDKPMISHVVERLRPQVSEILISANRNLERYRELGFSVIPDTAHGLSPDDGYQGPIAGIIACLGRIRSDFAVIVPCDAPLIPSDLVANLAQRVDQHTRLVLFRVNDRLQPLFGLYHRELADDLQAYFESGERKLMTWCESINPQIISVEDRDGEFSNINSPEEMAVLKP
ncbi:MAG: molybdenum cofactor guanylyltransferase MobA [Ketobacteraceae bacterium]|nr:molybdenum cofactor guanylyltransferase MobA [Ketobacteraceae bacterium]